MQFDQLHSKFNSVVIANGTSNQGNLIAGLLFCETLNEIEVLIDAESGMEITVEIPEELRGTPTFIVGYDVPFPIISFNT